MSHKEKLNTGGAVILTVTIVLGEEDLGLRPDNLTTFIIHNF